MIHSAVFCNICHTLITNPRQNYYCNASAGACGRIRHFTAESAHYLCSKKVRIYVYTTLFDHYIAHKTAASIPEVLHYALCNHFDVDLYYIMYFIGGGK
jgi:hypothetical protein